MRATDQGDSGNHINVGLIAGVSIRAGQTVASDAGAPLWYDLPASRPKSPMSSRTTGSRRKTVDASKQCIRECDR